WNKPGMSKMTPTVVYICLCPLQRRISGQVACAAYASASRGYSSGDGNFGKLCTAAVVAQGSFSLVIVSTNGTKPRGSSSSVARTLTKLSKPSGRVNIQLMQCGQKKWRVAPWSPPITGSPRVMEKPSAGIAALRENALAVI